MKNYDYILFDLDGTMTDPGVGITNSVAYALEKMGVTVEDKTPLYKFIGPPLMESFSQFYGFTPEQTEQAILYYREYYTDKGMFENVVYEGMEDLLKTLHATGKKLVVATCKLEEFAMQVLEHFDMAKYFHFIAGSSKDNTRIQKDEVIAYALETCGINKASAVMIGDREHDILGAKKTGLDVIGVLYGYGSKDELANAGATVFAETVGDIQKLVG